jgi:Uma2 family endonuclease
MRIAGMALNPNYYVTPEEYLAIERKAETKSEYVDGIVYAMAGATERHNTLVANLIMSIGIQLRGRPCKVYPSDLKVRIPNSTRFFYPDVSVVCGETLFADDHKDVILNPILLVEVLSEATAAFDRGTKFIAYQQIESLKECLLVAQSEQLVEHFTRQRGDSWIYRKVTSAEGVLTLSSIQCEITLKEIYDKTL